MRRVRPRVRSMVLMAALGALLLVVVPAQMGVRAPGPGVRNPEPLPAVDAGWVTNAERVLATVDDHLGLIGKAKKSYKAFPEKRRTEELRGWMDRLDANARELERIRAAIGPALATIRGYEKQRARLGELRDQILAAVRALDSLRRLPEPARRATGVRMRDLETQLARLRTARTAQEDVARAWGKKAIAATRIRTLQPAPDTPALAAKVLRATKPADKLDTKAGTEPGDGNGSPAGDRTGGTGPVVSIAGLSGGTRVLLAQEDPMSKPISEVRPGDPIIVTDMSSGDPAIASVRDVSRRTARIMPVSITTRGGTITAAPAQRFFDYADKSWVTAASLDSGDTLTTLTSPQSGACTQTASEGCEGPYPMPVDSVRRGSAATVTVYTLSVAGMQNFYAGELMGPVLVR